ATGHEPVGPRPHLVARRQARRSPADSQTPGCPGRARPGCNHHSNCQGQTMTANASPEIANSIQIGECTLNYHDQGEGDVILLIHGSGPGVTGWANWRGVIPTLSQRARIIAPDMLGFGYTSCPADWKLDPATWVQSLVGLLDALDIPRVSIVGNSFGGAIALAFAKAHPERVQRLVLILADGQSLPLTNWVDKVWSQQASLDAMRELMGFISYDNNINNDFHVRMRYEVRMYDGVKTRLAKLIPEPR